MRIGSREIGPEQSPYIIAELGVNHDGSVDRAMELVRAADEAHADAVKLQLFETDRLMSRAARLAVYQSRAGESDPFAMLRRLELGIDQMRPVVEHARDLGMQTIVTVFSVELVAVAEGLASAYGGFDAYKTASPDITNRPLLEALAATGKPLILSTGAATLDEVSRAIGWLAGARDRLAVLQCVSAYPTPMEHASLGGIAAIRGVFGEPVGYSDHTPSIETGWMAVACGASILEKHFTYSRSAAGPDHAASLEPVEFMEYGAKAVERRLSARRGGAGGEGAEHVTCPVSAPPGKPVLAIEEDVRTVSRQSLTTTRALPAGHRLAREDLTIKRPGTGIPPYELDATLGRVLVRGVEADMPLTQGDLGEERA
ncbi:MAG: N-acetylneuraminate synthase family protein [Phycisphaeraceae bacterium]|nr:N-acetylneuraminate synthase family protein [Phycisphaeraceae bacterium]